MRRGITAVVGTVLGTALLVGAKLGHGTPGDLAAAQPESAQPDTVQPGTSARPAPSATLRSKAPSPKAKPSAKASPKPGAGGTKPDPGGLTNGTFQGPGVSERFGTITVTIEVSGGRIGNVDATCSCSGRSQSISQSAFGKLEPRVLTAQSADVQSVSGATYTFEAYQRSLAAAIDKAKA